jgi:hypothetical protein
MMRTVMAGVLMLALGACGGDDGGSDDVTALTEAEQVALCERFIDGVCDEPIAADWCAGCAGVLCGLPAMPGVMNRECEGVTVAQVDACAATTTFEVCTMGGGCVFDVGDELCP